MTITIACTFFYTCNCLYNVITFLSLAISYRNCQVYDKAVAAYLKASEAYYDNNSYPSNNDNNACNNTLYINTVIVLSIIQHLSFWQVSFLIIIIS